MMVGYLQVAYPGSQESKGAFAVGAATYDENTVTFSVGAHRDFLHVYEYLLDGLRPRRRTPLRRHAAPGTIHWNGWKRSGTVALSRTRSLRQVSARY